MVVLTKYNKKWCYLYPRTIKFNHVVHWSIQQHGPI